MQYVAVHCCTVHCCIVHCGIMHCCIVHCCIVAHFVHTTMQCAGTAIPTHCTPLQCVVIHCTNRIALYNTRGNYLHSTFANSWTTSQLRTKPYCILSKGHFFSRCVQLFYFNYTTTLLIKEQQVNSNHKKRKFLTHWTFAMHAVFTRWVKHTAAVVHCTLYTLRHYLNSQSVFIWCELDYSCQPETWCCWVPSLEKTAPPKLVATTNENTPATTTQRHPLEKISSSRSPLKVKMI